MRSCNLSVALPAAEAAVITAVTATFIKAGAVVVSAAVPVVIASSVAVALAMTIKQLSMHSLAGNEIPFDNMAVALASIKEW